MANQFSDFWLNEDGVEEIFRGDEETSQRYLEKPVERVFESGQAGDPGYPGRPYQPARDAYCIDVEEERTVGVTEFYPVSGGAPAGNYARVSPVFSQVYDESISDFRYVLEGWLVIYSETTTVIRQKCFDAQPAKPAIPPIPPTPPTPGQWRIDNRFGWDAGARSRKYLDGDLTLQFFVRPSTGTAVGITGDKVGNHYRVLPHCLVFHGGGVLVYEDGDLVFGPVAHDPVLRYGLTRVDGEVRYTANFVPFFTSSKASVGSMMVVPLIYAGGDRVI